MYQKPTYEELEKRVQELETSEAEWKRTEAALRESRNKYQTLFEAANDAIFVASAETGIILDANQKAEQLTGRPRNDIIGTHQTALHPEEQKEYAEKIFRSGVEARKRMELDDFLIQHGDGRKIPVEISPSFIEIDGKPCVLGIFRDVSEKRERIKSLQRYEAVIKAVTDPVSFVDREYIYRIVNDAYLSYYSKPPKEIIGHPIWEMMGKDQFENIVRPRLDRCFNGETVRYEDWFSYPDGSKAYQEVCYYPMFDNDGEKIIGASVSVRNRTAQKEAEQALHKHRNMLARTEHIAQIGSWEWDISADTITWSPGLFRIFKMDHHGKAPTWSEHEGLCTPEDSKRLHQAAESAISNALPYELELRILRKDGKTRIGLVKGFPETDAKGKVVRLVGFLQDITDRKTMEKALEKEHNRLFALLDMMPAFVYLQKKDYSISFANNTFRKLFGEPEGLKCHEMLHGGRKPCESCPTFRVFETGKPESWEWKDNKERTYLVYDNLFPGSEDEDTVLEIGIDITERRRAEAELKKSRALLEATGRMARVGGWEMDAETSTVKWTEETCRIHEVPLDYQPSFDQAILFYPPEVRKQLIQAVQKALDHGQPYDLEVPFVTAKGKRLWSRTICQPVVVGGETVKLSGTFQDITDRKHAEMKLQEYADRLENMVEERTRDLKKAQEELIVKERLAVLGHFAGSISHELRNPLAVIDGAVYLLNMKLKNPNEKTLECLKRISNNVKKSTNIIQSLLNLSKMEKPKTVKTRVGDFISDVIKSAKIPGTVEVTSSLPQEPVFLDIEPEQIRMALKNIIKNAVQAMDESGALTVSVHPIESDQTEPDQVEIYIADTGPGIAPEHLEKVFEPLFSTKTHGIGFGLSITKMIVENHGGSIRATSNPECGAVFYIRLPVSGYGG